MTVKCVTDDVKRKIYDDYSKELTKSLLAKKYNVSTRTIGRIIEEIEQGLDEDETESPQVEPELVVDISVEEFEEQLQEVNQPLNANYTFIMTPDSLSITLVSEDQYDTVNIDNDHEKFQEAYDKLLSDPKSQENLSEIYSMLNVKYNIEKFTEGRVTVLPQEGRVVYNDDDGNPVGQFDGKLVDRILDSISQNKPVTNLIKFADKLTENPSYRAVHELYEFLEACDIEINDDGDVVCFKRVREDYLDNHSGTYDNSPGKTLKVPRNLVDEDSENTCSYGLHVCSKAYLRSYYGARILKVIVHPKDFVAIPKDYYDGLKAKARTCGYYVEADVTDTIVY